MFVASSEVPKVRPPAPLLLCAIVAVATTGCGGSNEARLSSYLEELEFEAPLESVVAVSLGEFEIPMAIRTSDDMREPPVWVRIRFKLFAEVDPRDRTAVLDALQRYEGPLRDAVIRICRRSTPEELDDPRLSAMKARLLDAAKPMLGERRVRQLIIKDYLSEAL